MKRPPSMKAVLVVWLTMPLIAASFTSDAVAANIRITAESDISEISKTAVAGDVLILTNGTWTDSSLKFERLRGTQDDPITIKAEKSGRVIFTGKTRFAVSGEHVIVSGLVFRNATGSDVLSLRTHSERHANHSRVTDCVFEEIQMPDKRKESRWLSVYGSNNRVDHCDFAGKTSKGTTLVVWVGKDFGRHRIDHNHFGHRPKLGKNGGETIRLGTSGVSESDCRTTAACLTICSYPANGLFFVCMRSQSAISGAKTNGTTQHVNTKISWSSLI